MHCVLVVVLVKFFFYLYPPEERAMEELVETLECGIQKPEACFIPFSDGSFVC